MSWAVILYPATALRESIFTVSFLFVCSFVDVAYSIMIHIKVCIWLLLYTVWARSVFPCLIVNLLVLWHVFWSDFGMNFKNHQTNKGVWNGSIYSDRYISFLLCRLKTQASVSEKGFSGTEYAWPLLYETFATNEQRIWISTFWSIEILLVSYRVAGFYLTSAFHLKCKSWMYDALDVAGNLW